MAKVELNNVANLQSETSAVQTLNDNFDRIEAALENTLSRDGTTPNQMGSPLDMNGKAIMNLPAPRTGSEPARLVDLQESLTIDGAVVPPLIEDYILSNADGALVWVAGGSIPGVGDLDSSNNLSDLSNIVTARGNLGLGSAATENVGTSGAVLGRLNGNLTYSGNLTFNGFSTFNNIVNLSGTVNHRLTATPTSLTDDSIGYRCAPVNFQFDNYTFVLTDAGKMVQHQSASAHTYTIPPFSSVAYPIGTVILISNYGTGVLTIARGSGVALRIAGSATDANATVAAYGFASIVSVGSNAWVISGAGVA